MTWLKGLNFDAHYTFDIFSSMSGSSSDSESSQCDSEYNYIPGYITEDESNDTSHEIGTQKQLIAKL